MIEIQIHPSDIRRKVRYYFLDRKAVVIAILAGALLLLLVVASMAVAPSVIRRVYKNNYLLGMRQERAVQREQLKQHVAQMKSIEKSIDEHRLAIEKLTTVYGLDGAVLGQGGDGAPEFDEHESTAKQVLAATRQEESLALAVRRLEAQIDTLARFETANAEMVRHTPSILPLPADRFVLTSPFGNRMSPFTRAPDFHKGLDLAAAKGTPIFATADGVVTFSGRYPLSRSVSWWRFGNVVVVRHSDHFITIYAHCDSVAAVPGQIVRQGQAIATVGSSGWSTNSHLHYEVRSDLERPAQFDPIDPRIYILNYQWSDEEKLLIGARSSKDYSKFDPLPSAFVGRRRGV